MQKDTKRAVDDMEMDSISTSPIKNVRRNVTCLLDLSNDILLLIFRYLPPSHILYSFYTPDTPNMRLHRICSDYYTNIKLDAIAFDQYAYFHGLFLHSNNPFQPKSLILSNEHVSCITQRYFTYVNTNVIQSIFVNLKCLTLIDCSTIDLESLVRQYMDHLTQLEYLHITVHKMDNDFSFGCTSTCDGSIGRLLFNSRLSALYTINIELSGGLALHNSLHPHQTLRHVQIVLQTIDDLYILLNGLIPNVETMIVELREKRLLTCRRPQCTSSYPRLTEFTLLEPRIGLIIDDIEFILNYMPAVVKLTLSIRDTPDPAFCHGRAFEEILVRHAPHLRKFDYTMTHRVTDRTLIEDFIRWPMNVVFYENENAKWAHIFSLPWPSNREDKRRLPIVSGGYNLSVTSDVKRDEHMNHVMIITRKDLFQLKTRFRRACQLTTCLSMDIILPRRISKLVLTEQTPVGSMSSIVHPDIRHLIVQRRLVDDGEISILAHQFPNVKYLQLSFPLNQSLFDQCFKTLFSSNDSIDNKPRFWTYLINFCTVFIYEQSNSINDDSSLHRWLIENTDLKYRKFIFYANCSDSMFSIWL